MTSDVDTIDALFARYGPIYRWLVTLTVMIGAIAMGFATSMVNVAVPAVMGAYGVGLDQAQWMATGFLATMSTTMLLSSWLIEVLGQRVTYFLTITVFAAGSLISATAPNIDLWSSVGSFRVQQLASANPWRCSRFSAYFLRSGVVWR